MDGLARLSGSALPLQDTAFSDNAIGDFGGDGKLDIIWRDPANGNNQIWNMNGAIRMSVDRVVRMSPDFDPMP